MQTCLTDEIGFLRKIVKLKKKAPSLVLAQMQGNILLFGLWGNPF